MPLYDVVHLRDILLRDKRFLLELYVNSNYQNRRLISGATELHLNTVLKVLHLIVNNEIKIDEDDYKGLKRAKKANLLKNKIKTKSDFLVLLNSEVLKRQFLLQFAAVYKYLLGPLFEEDY